MIDPNTPASVRVRAAEAIFNHAAKAIEIEDIEARVQSWNVRQERRTSDYDQPKSPSAVGGSRIAL
jgi:hypothetical protein